MRIVVLGGGRSSEHEISLASAASVASGLRRAGHDVVEITISREGEWSRAGGERVVLEPGGGLEGADVVFPVLHGPFGEDGTVQGLLECLDVAYVGAGVLASALCMDKLVFKDLMARHGIPQVAYGAVTSARWAREREAVLAELAELGLPVFVKPARLGSSVGIAKAGSEQELAHAVEAALEHDARVIVEAFSAGTEIECSVIGLDDPRASEPGEIVPKNEWYDYEAKYTPGGMELEIPARISPAARERVRALAVEAFRLADCAGLARVDFFVEGDDVLVNELNTMPGFTETSVFGKLFEASGMPYVELLEALVGFARERHGHERRFRH